jgi:tetratricopeptide (TPR) repeat protein
LQPSVGAYRNRGFARHFLGDNKGAIEDLNQAIKLNQRNALSYIVRGEFRSEAGDKRGAVDDYNCAIKLDPRLEYYHIRRHARSRIGDNTGALEDLGRIIKLDPDCAVDEIAGLVSDFVKSNTQVKSPP